MLPSTTDSLITCETSQASNLKEAVPASCIRFVVADSGPSGSHVNLELLKSESRTTLETSLSQLMKPGISGLREYMSSVHSLKSTTGVSQSTVLQTDDNHLDGFIEHFIRCDGMKYFGILEQIEFDYDERCKAYGKNLQENRSPEACKIRKKLEEIVEVRPVSARHDLRNFDFPVLLEKEVKIMNIDYKPKIFKMKEIHQYGMDIEDYWVGEIVADKHLDIREIYEKATEMLAELMCQAISLLVKMYEFLMLINQDDQVRKYMHSFNAACLTHLFSEYRRLLVEEVGAVGETFAGVVIKIPDLSDRGVIDVMTVIYNQINFVDICVSKVLRPAIPMILLFENSRVNLLEQRKKSILETYSNH